ncbi:hypothetical protein K2P97_00355 [bacterium]|nr:hypothetical protein [bacterium]
MNQQNKKDFQVFSEHFRCQPNAFGAISSESKACTCCQQEKPLLDFHKNPSKRSGLESHCKACVSARNFRRKAKERAQKAKLKKSGAGFSSTVHGELSTTQLNAFADILGAAIKEIINDSETS